MEFGKRDIYPIELIRTGCFLIRDMRRNPPKNGFYRYDISRALVIYTFQKIGDKFLPLNREYKPIGLGGFSFWAEYEEYPFLMIPKERINFEKLTFQKGPESGYFFDDSCYPEGKHREKYLKTVENVLGIFLPDRVDKWDIIHAD